MSLDAKHPLYTRHIADWAMGRDLYAGEGRIKERGQEYLPPTASMRLDGLELGQPGTAAYEAYRLRAILPDYFKEAVESLVGIMHQKEPTFELPKAMESLKSRATVKGEGLPALLRSINAEQLITGRIGLHLDLPNRPVSGPTLPYIATYTAENIINWDEGATADNINSLNLVVLNESGKRRGPNGFDWEDVTRYRVLMLGDLLANEPEGSAIYKSGLFEVFGKGGLEFTDSVMIEPKYQGRALGQIPFVFINSRDIVPEPDEPPLLGLARLVLAIYRGEADYRQSLHMQGQDTLVVTGRVQDGGEMPGQSANPLRTGAGALIETDPGGDAKYIGVSSAGLPEQREALHNDRAEAEAKAGRLIAPTQSQQESGTALKTRLTAQTASLNQIALAGAAGLETLLKICAVWIGANPDQVKVVPNLEFADFDYGGQELVQIMTARGMGAPLSKRSIHRLMVDRGLTQMAYEDELDLVAEEDAGAGTPLDDYEDEA